MDLAFLNSSAESFGLPALGLVNFSADFIKSAAILTLIALILSSIIFV